MADNLYEINCVVLGPFETNCFIVRPVGQSVCWVVDPGPGSDRSAEPRALLNRLKSGKLQVERVLVTHGHGDHIAGIPAVKLAYPRAVVTVSQDDAAMLADAELNLSADFGMPVTAGSADQCVRPGDRLDLGGGTWQVLDTSGHTPGGVSFYCRSAGVVIVGDALFAGSIGRSDIPGGDGERLIANIREQLMSLPDDTRVLCGHGPETTIGAERRGNPYV
jgi:hydroxyacylglutathione hydrolase